MDPQRERDSKHSIEHRWVATARRFMGALMAPRTVSGEGAAQVTKIIRDAENSILQADTWEAQKLVEVFCGLPSISQRQVAQLLTSLEGGMLDRETIDVAQVSSGERHAAELSGALRSGIPAEVLSQIDREVTEYARVFLSKFGPSYDTIFGSWAALSAESRLTVAAALMRIAAVEVRG